MKIMTIGELLVDLTQTGINENGIPQYSANPGGAPANVAVAASLMGAESAFVGRVGDDAFGKMLAQTLSSKNIDISHLSFDDEHPTTLAIVSLDDKGDRSFSFYRKGGADTFLSKCNADASFIEKFDIIHFGSVSLTDEPSASAIKHTVETAKAMGKIVSYDPNYRPLLWSDEAVAVAKMCALLKNIDIIKVSDEEALLLTGEGDIKSAAKSLLDEGIGIILVTLGENGAYYLTKYAEGFCPAYTGKVADTNGAGDTFLGTFLTSVDDLDALIKNKDGSLQKAVSFACAAAGLSTRKSGAIPSMPTKNEVADFILHYGK